MVRPASPLLLLSLLVLPLVPALACLCLAALLSTTGCSSWRTVHQAGPAVPDAPSPLRPGDRVRLLRHDGAIREGVIATMDADSIYCQEFATAWTDISEVVPLAAAIPSDLVLNHKTRLTTIDAERYEGYLSAIGATTLTLADHPARNDFRPPDLTTIPIAAIATIEQQPPSAGATLVAVLGITAALTLVAALILVATGGYWDLGS